MAVAKNLKKMAEELESLLSPPLPSHPTPVIDESYLIAAEPPAVAEAAVDNDHLIPQLIRTVVEYTLTKSPAGATVEDIGAGITSGINEAVKHLGLDKAKVAEAVDDFLEGLSESVRGSLVE